MSGILFFIFACCTTHHCNVHFTVTAFTGCWNMYNQETSTHQNLKGYALMSDDSLSIISSKSKVLGSILLISFMCTHHCHVHFTVTAFTSCWSMDTQKTSTHQNLQRLAAMSDASLPILGRFSPADVLELVRCVPFALYMVEIEKLYVDFVNGRNECLQNNFGKQNFGWVFNFISW